MQVEQSELPDTSYEETPLLGSFIDEDDKPAILESKKINNQKRFATVDFGEMDPISFSKKGNRNEIVQLSPKGWWDQNFQEWWKNTSKKFRAKKKSKGLGPSTEEIIAKERKALQYEQIRQKPAEKKLKHSKKDSKELDAMNRKNDSIQQEIEAFEQEHCSILGIEEELQNTSLKHKT